MKRTLIFGNGTLHTKFLSEIQKGDTVIGVDRAAYWLLSHKVIPDIALGDFDSTTDKEFELIKKSIKVVKTFSPMKDKTDMEIALSTAKGETLVFGWSGSRADHMLATVHGIQDQILVDETNRIRLIGRGKTTIKRTSYRYISILPYTKSITISLTGFIYNLRRKRIKKGISLGVSNELKAAKGTIEIFSGRAWVIESND